MSGTDQKKVLKEEFKSFQNQHKYVPTIPDPKDLTQWHFTFRGTKDTPFEGGYYHFHFNLKEYPTKAPAIMALNPNGAFQLNQNICLVSLTSWHQEAWVRIPLDYMVTALQFAMTNEKDRGGIAFIRDITSSSAVANIKDLAIKSKDYVCPQCKKRLGDFTIEE